MTLVLNEDSVIDQAARDAVRKELEDYLAKNRRTFRRELIEDINNRWHPSNVVWTSTLYNVMRILSDPESYEIRDQEVNRLREFRAFAVRWTRYAVIPTIVDHLNDTFCGEGAGCFWRKDPELGEENYEPTDEERYLVKPADDRIYFRGQPETIFWIAGKSKPEEDPPKETKYPEALRFLLPEIFDPTLADREFLAWAKFKEEHDE